MADVPPSASAPQLRLLVENARTALDQGNFEYVLTVCAPLLEAQPTDLALRRVVRVAQLRKHRTRNAFFARARSGFVLAPFAWGGGNRNPAERFARLEKLLTGDPANGTALKLQAQAAMELGWDETAIFLHEAVREIAPTDRGNLLALGDAWLKLGRPDEALRAAEMILRDHPVDGDAQQLLRKASIAQAVTKGNWEGTGDYREKLRKG